MPQYMLSDLVQINTPGHRGLKSSKHKPTNHQWGETSFQSAAPRLGNSLPETVKLFKLTWHSQEQFKN